MYLKQLNCIKNRTQTCLDLANDLLTVEYQQHMEMKFFQFNQTWAQSRQQTQCKHIQTQHVAPKPPNSISNHHRQHQKTNNTLLKHPMQIAISAQDSKTSLPLEIVKNNLEKSEKMGFAEEIDNTLGFLMGQCFSPSIFTIYSETKTIRVILFTQLEQQNLTKKQQCYTMRSASWSEIMKQKLKPQCDRGSMEEHQGEIEHPAFQTSYSQREQNPYNTTCQTLQHLCGHSILPS